MVKRWKMDAVRALERLSEAATEIAVEMRRYNDRHEPEDHGED